MFIITDKNVQNVQFFNFFVVRDLPLLPLYQTNACKTCKFTNSSNELPRQILTFMSMPYQNKRFESTRLQSKIKSSFGEQVLPLFRLSLLPHSLSAANISKKLTKSSAQLIQIVPCPQRLVSTLPRPAPRANSKITKKYIPALCKISLSCV